MYVEQLNAPLLATLGRPDLGVLGAGRRIGFDLDEARPFRLEREDGRDTAVVLGPLSSAAPAPVRAFHLRHALELAWLGDALPAVGPALVALAAARVAALFFRLDALPDAPDPASWVATLASPTPPDDDTLRLLAIVLPTAKAAVATGDAIDWAPLRDGWDAIGPVDTLLASGGDRRLGIDARTRLNHYGCAPRPRPWAVTYASSTASSLSERGFAAAEAARRTLLARVLRGQRPQSVAALLEDARGRIGAHYTLSARTGVVLCASGTDAELLALGAIAAARPGRALSTVLTAPEETGSGVPLAAVGRHFAPDTARGRTVPAGAPVAELPADTERLDLAVRAADGSLLDPDAVDRAAEALVANAVGRGRHVLLHLLDCSKTGLLAPSIECAARIARRHRGWVDVVVDACQARLADARVRSYVACGWTVLLTGSKFFTGPPFCGAILLPAPVFDALSGGTTLATGLADYTVAADWPAALAAGAARALAPDGGNIGMALRWHAALGEMDAFRAVPPERTRATLLRFTDAVRDAIRQTPRLVPVAVPALRRPVLADEAGTWDDVQTIIPFLVLDEAGRPYGLADTRALYGWLNADVTAALPPGLGATERFLASLRCHIGQPAPVADGFGAIAGALRISAGARLVSGEPSHAGIDRDGRLEREIADACACLDKLALLLRHHDRLRAVDPAPSFGDPSERDGPGLPPEGVTGALTRPDFDI